jgi:hypothetical protein
MSARNVLDEVRAVCASNNATEGILTRLQGILRGGLTMRVADLERPDRVRSI